MYHKKAYEVLFKKKVAYIMVISGQNGCPDSQNRHVFKHDCELTINHILQEHEINIHCSSKIRYECMS